MRKIAMLVANDTFPEDASMPPLRFTQNDASALKEILDDPETCGFETKVYLNETSRRILMDLERISSDLSKADTLLFYYSGHGRLRGNELCLVSRETTTLSLGATSIPAREVLNYLQESHARRRVLILDCCHSGAIGQIYRGGDAESALSGLAHGFGSYILTASTAIQLAEERESDGHGIFTKALIDCLRDGGKESITVDDWYDYAYDRLRVDAKQTPVKWGLREVGPSFEIGNFRAKHERERELERERLEQERRLERERLERQRQLERDQLISTARARLGAYATLGELTEEQVEEAVALLKRDESRLFPRDRRYRDDLIRFSMGEASFLEVFGAGHSLRPDPAPKPPEDEVGPPVTPTEAPVAEPSITPPEPTVVDRPVARPEPEPLQHQGAVSTAALDPAEEREHTSGVDPQVLPEPLVVDQPVTPPEPAVFEEPVLLAEPPVVDQPVTPPVEQAEAVHVVASNEVGKTPNVRLTFLGAAAGAFLLLVAVGSWYFWTNQTSRQSPSELPYKPSTSNATPPEPTGQRASTEDVAAKRAEAERQILTALKAEEQRGRIEEEAPANPQPLNARVQALPFGLLANDMQRLSNFDATRSVAIAEALAGATAEDRADLEKVLAGDPQPIAESDLKGEWRCRTLKLGGSPPPLTIYGSFKCRIFVAQGKVVFQKTSGSQRTRGELQRIASDRFVYAGAGTLNDDPIRLYGADPKEDEVAILVKVSRNRLRLEFPAPYYESNFDIIELLR